MRTFCAALFVVAMMAPASAYTDEQVSACTPDVMRLCSDAIPDEGRITKCMIQKKKANQRGVHDGHEKRPGARVARRGQVTAPSDIVSNGIHPCWRSSERPPEAPGAFLFAGFRSSVFLYRHCDCATAAFISFAIGRR